MHGAQHVRPRCGEARWQAAPKAGSVGEARGQDTACAAQRGIQGMQAQAGRTGSGATAMAVRDPVGFASITSSALANELPTLTTRV